MNIIDKHNLQQSIEILEKRLWNAYDKDQHCWVGRQWMNAAVSAEFLILCKYIDFQDPFMIKGALEEIKSSQNPDGGFPAYYKGPSVLSLSCNCHLAMRLYSDLVPADIIHSCLKFIEQNGGLKKAMLISKFYHFLFRMYPVRKLPQIRPGLILVPKWIGLSIYDMASWVRSWIVPISILWHQEKYKNYKFWIKPYIPNLRKYSLRKAENWILDHQEKDGSWYGVFHSTMISILALYSLGYSKQDPVMQKAFAFILSLHDQNNGTIRQQPFLGPVWDSALSLIALEKSKNELEPYKLNSTASFLLKQQVFRKGDWSKHNNSNPGAWSFEFNNDHYPDVDTTSVVLRALKSFEGEKSYRNPIDKGLKWLESMQNRDGSWAAFDKNNNHRFIEWYLDVRKYNIGKGRGLVLDKGTPDLTAHVLETLSEFGYKESKHVTRAIKWLKRNQEADGSWFGRWGLCYIYGTGAVLEALNAVGEDRNSSYIRKAVHFLKDHQNVNGGFGESPEAYYNSKLKAKGVSTLTQTSWAISGLIKAGEASSECVKRGVSFLTSRIMKGEKEHELIFQAVAAPPLYQRYEFYPIYFPLMTLQQYLVHLQKSENFSHR